VRTGCRPEIRENPAQPEGPIQPESPPKRAAQALRSGDSVA